MKSYEIEKLINHYTGNQRKKILREDRTKRKSESLRKWERTQRIQLNVDRRNGVRNQSGMQCLELH